MTEIELAYLAGFVDGEGSIGIVVVAKHKRYVTQICVTNTNVIPINLFVKLFGGKVRLRDWAKNKKAIGKNWKPCYEWKLTAIKAANVIRSLRPYLLIKAKQADLVLAAQTLKSEKSAVTWRWHPELKLERDAKLERLKQECAILNKRGL